MISSNIVTKYVLILFISLFLQSCITAEDRAKQARAQKASDDRVCKSYGFEKSTTAYGQCRMQLDRDRSQRKAEAYRALSNSLNDLSKQMTPTYCNSTGTVFGNTVSSQTTCY